MADENMLSMDFTTNLPLFGFWSAMQTADQCSTGDKTSLDLLQNLHDSDPIIEETTWEFKKVNEIKNLEYPFLDQSSSCSYVCTTSSTSVSTASLIQETEEDSSVKVGLDTQFHLGGQNSSSPDKSSMNDLKAYRIGCLLDLELSLSIVSSASAPSIAETVTDPKLNSSNDSVFANQVLSSNEEGSAHCWIFGACLQPSAVNLETSSSFSSERKECAEADSTSVVLNGKSTTMQALDRSVTCTSGASNSQKHKNRISICSFQGCTKGARGASGLCIAHGGGQRCHRLGCQKGAEGRTIYCKAHGGGRRCQLLGCTKSAEGRTDYCIAHGGGRRCSHPSCTRAARGKSGLCIRHGGGKRCQWENCTKSAEGSSGLCIAHGGGRRCQIEDCTKGAQGGTLLCKAHGGGKRCTFLGCTKGAEGSTSLCKGHGGGKRCSYHGGGVCPKSVHGGTPFCVAHGGGKRCAVSGCPRSARGRTSFCVGHGGGKRCKFEGCEKSAQGSTDFCKAHGGGRRCSWGQPGSNFGAGEPVCNKLARGKIVLCAAHNALVQDHRVRGGIILRSTTIPYPLHQLTSQFGFSAPEGRVRGANLIPTLASRSGFGDNIGDQRATVTSNHGASHISNSTYLWV